MNKNNAMAPTFRPTGEQPEAIRIPEQVERQPKTRVVHASNQSVPLEIGILLVTVFSIASVVIGYFGAGAAGLSVPLRIAAGGLLMLIMALITMAFITGDASALFESWQSENTERKALDVEAERIDANREIMVLHLENTRDAQRFENEERIAQIDADKRLQLGYIDASREQPTGDTWTPAKPTPAIVAVRAFLEKCYTRDGYNIPDYVASDDGMLTRAPWNGAWKGQPWRDEAKNLIKQYALNQVGNQPYLKYSTNHEAQEAIPTFGGQR